MWPVLTQKMGNRRLLELVLIHRRWQDRASRKATRLGLSLVSIVVYGTHWTLSDMVMTTG